jgi:hypothetical protein
MRRLVEIDPDTFYAREVDAVRLKREGRELREYILNIPVGKDVFNYRQKVLPIVEAALNDTLKLPFSASDEPLSYEIREALLPEDYAELHAAFFNTAVGEDADTDNTTERDGKLFAYMDFEEEPPEP